jgi:FliG C-terminal domain
MQLERTSGTTIAICQDTCTQVEGTFEVHELDRITVTGYEAPVTVYEALRRRGELAQEQARRVERYQQGLEHYRRKELAEALECFKQGGVQDLGYGFSKRYATRCWIHLEVPEFEAVTRLHGEEIQEILREVDNWDLREALREMDAEYREVFLSQMSQRVRRFMEEEMDAVQLTAYSRETIADKHRAIIAIAERLAREGRISLDPDEGAGGT